MTILNAINAQVAEGEGLDRALELFALDHRAEALEIARRIVREHALDAGHIDKCMWMFNVAEAWADAIEVARLGTVLEPTSAARYSQLSSLLQSAQRFSDAAIAASRASDLAPESLPSALSAANLHNAVESFYDAAIYAMRAVRLEATAAEAYHQLAYAVYRMGQLENAAALAKRGVECDLTSEHRVMFAASVAAQLGNWADATELLSVHCRSTEPSALALRVYSGYLDKSGDVSKALVCIDKALVLEPNAADFHLHRAGVLGRLDLFAEAAAALEKAGSLNPSDSAIRLNQIHYLLESGDITRAMVVGAGLVQLDPGNDTFVGSMLHVLTMKVDTARVQEFASVIEAKRLQPPRVPRPPRTFMDGLKTQPRIIGALIMREMTTRYSESKLGYAWALLEPMIHIGSLAVVFNIMMHGRPPIGDYFFLFYFTGIVAYHMLTHTSGQLTYALAANKVLLSFPLVTNLDAFVARALLELFTEFVVAIILICCFLAFGVPAIPYNIPDAIAALLAIWMLGFGIGLINGIIEQMNKTWEHIWNIISRILYFGSGIFYVPGAMPVWIRDILLWNPLLHGVDWLRTAFFPEYHPSWMNKGYLLGVGLGTIVIGLQLERALRRKLREKAT